MVYFSLIVENVIENNRLQWVTSDPPLQNNSVQQPAGMGRRVHLHVPKWAEGSHKKCELPMAL